jgi:hypothetical protein
MTMASSTSFPIYTTLVDSITELPRLVRPLRIEQSPPEWSSILMAFAASLTLLALIHPRAGALRWVPKPQRMSH